MNAYSSPLPLFTFPNEKIPSHNYQQTLFYLATQSIRVNFAIKEYLTDYSGAIAVNFEHAFVCWQTLLKKV